MQNFRLSMAHVKFQNICTLIGSFCWKYVKLQLKKYKGLMSHYTEEWCKIWWKTNLLFLKNMQFDWSLLCKVYNFRPKKVQRSYLSRHWRVMQNLKQNWLVVWKMTWGIWQIFTRTLKFGLWWYPFVQSRKCTNKKFTEELCVIKLKNLNRRLMRKKIWREIDLSFQIEIRNLTNFDSSNRKSQKFTF